MGFVAKPPALLRSAVWRSLGIYGRRMLDALEVEHCNHGGKENGYLVLTYDDAVRWGIPRRSFRATLAELVRKKLVEITHQGSYRGSAQLDPNLYRLTYLRFALRGVGTTQYFPATHDWVDVELAAINGRGPPLRVKQHTPPKTDSASSKYDTHQVIKYDTGRAASG
jgi:hypothetical protein